MGLGDLDDSDVPARLGHEYDIAIVDPLLFQDKTSIDVNSSRQEITSPLVYANRT